MKHTLSPRWLAGTRANKRRPVARGERLSDIRRDGWPMDYLPPTDHGRRPNHAARAVSIDACFGARLPERGNPGAVAGSRGRSAATMTASMRAEVYYAQGPGDTYQNGFTRRQARRYWHKGRRTGELV
jgi:hypothetical protein